MAAHTNQPTVTQHLFPSHCSKPSASPSLCISPLCTSSWREDVTSTCLGATPTFCSSHLFETSLPPLLFLPPPSSSSAPSLSKSTQSCSTFFFLDSTVYPPRAVHLKELEWCSPLGVLSCIYVHRPRENEKSRVYTFALASADFRTSRSDFRV